MKKLIAGVVTVFALTVVPAGAASAGWWGSCYFNGTGMPICHAD